MKTKIRQRLFFIFNNTAFRLFSPFSQLVISFLIITLEDAGLWGAYVKTLIIPNLALVLLNWGNHTYLLKQFSTYPAHISQEWQQSFWSRFPLLLIFAAIYLIWPMSLILQSGILVWLLHRYVYKSLDAVIQHAKAFRKGLIIEVAGFIATLFLVYFWQHELSLVLLIWVVAIIGLVKVLSYLWLFRQMLFKQLHFSWHKAPFKKGRPYLLLDFSGLLETRMDLYCVAWLASESLLGQYQVLITLFMYVKSVA